MVFLLRATEIIRYGTKVLTDETKYKIQCRSVVLELGHGGRLRTEMQHRMQYEEDVGIEGIGKGAHPRRVDVLVGEEGGQSH